MSNDQSFHAGRLSEPSSWSGIGGVLATLAGVTSGQVSTILSTVATLAFGAAYFLKERSAGVEEFTKAASAFFQKDANSKPTE